MSYIFTCHYTSQKRISCKTFVMDILGTTAITCLACVLSRLDLFYSERMYFFTGSSHCLYSNISVISSPTAVWPVTSSFGRKRTSSRRRFLNSGLRQRWFILLTNFFYVFDRRHIFKTNLNIISEGVIKRCVCRRYWNVN